MTLQSVKSKVEEHQRETREAARKQRDLEGKIVANQAPDSELGKAEAALEESQLKLDAEVHRILKLPAHSGPTDEEDRFKERSRLNEDQRSQLHQDAEYQAALDGVRAASEEASRVRHALFAKDAEWQAAFKERQSSEQSMLAAEKEQHRSGMAAAAGRNQLRNASEVAAYARQLIGEGESQLSVLGVKPKAPPKTSGSSSGSGKTAK
jgi:hypothetical protein